VRTFACLPPHGSTHSKPLISSARDAWRWCKASKSWQSRSGPRQARFLQDLTKVGCGGVRLARGSWRSDSTLHPARAKLGFTWGPSCGLWPMRASCALTIHSSRRRFAARLNSSVGPHKSKICSTARFIGKRLPACSSDGLFGACRDPHPFRFRPGAARTLWFLAIGAGGTGLSEFPASDCCAPTGSASAACADCLPCSPCLVRTTPSVRPNKSFKPTPRRGFLASFNGTL
jgi:hypothetical protein